MSIHIFLFQCVSTKVKRNLYIPSKKFLNLLTRQKLKIQLMMTRNDNGYQNMKVVKFYECTTIHLKY
jgi:hypothetical protein